MKNFIIILVMTCPLFGQVSKKPVTEAEYKLWGTLENSQLSDYGNWASYSVRYESGKDTLFIKHTKTLKTYAFAGGTDGQFAKEAFFVCRGTDGGLVWTNLKNGKQQTYPEIRDYTIVLGGRRLILLKNVGSAGSDLLFVGTDGTLVHTIPKVTVYSLSPKSNKLVCDSEKKLRLIDLNHLKTEVIVDAVEQKYQQIAWQPDGSSFTYLTDGPKSTIGYFRVNEKKGYRFDRNQFSDFPKEAVLYYSSVAELSVSDDGKRIFFGIKEKEPTMDTTGVQVWNTADKILYPARAALKEWTVRPKLAVWFPEQQQFRMVTDAQFPYQQVLPGQEWALLYNPIQNEPQFDRDAPIDYYLQNIATGQSKLILQKFSDDQNKIGISGAGRFIAYFMDRQWWLYEVKSGTRRNLTSQTGQSFTEEKYDRSGEEKVSGIAGWTQEDKEVLVYDTYDLWLLKTDGSSALRLTKGREEKIVYRLVPRNAYTSLRSFDSGVLHLNDGLLLEAVSAAKSGYFTWTTGKGLQKLVFESNRIGGIKRSLNGVIIYTREQYHVAPQLVVQFSSNKNKVLYQSNAQQQNYQWGFSKLITYENAKGKELHGALFYPAGFDADKSYPMVVYIYERLSDFYNQYVNPSLLNSEGFNISNLTTQGYFVLLPDIAYEEGKTGRSALDCVTAAVDEVLANESVDPKRLGLFGHSFGGYETNFIITQTNRFATAVSGSGMADFISSYLAVGNRRPNGWRYEFNQNRMGVSLFDDYQKYLDNSPITFAKQVQTPVLLWSGNADQQVDYYQSMEFHLALRRLQKPNILLLYEGEDHVLMKREHQIDLTHRTQQWFDYYLKGGRKPDWLRPDRL
jgi:dipeptidyl aminopeptidase/acylaminoacyl peptidase